MTTTDLTLNGVALSTAVPTAIVTRPTRPLVGRRRNEFVDVPGRSGSWKFPEEPGDRLLEFEIDIQTTSMPTRRAAVEALAAWADVGATANLIVDDEPDRYHSAILDNDPDPNEWLTRAEIVLRFRCDPYALAVTPSTDSIAVTGAGSDSDTLTITDTIEAEPVIELTPTNGTLATFTLTIEGVALSYSGPTIASGNTITISTIADVVTSGVNADTMLTGAYNPANLVMGLIAGAFPILQPGNNAWSISWTGTATAITFDLTWRERFR